MKTFKQFFNENAVAVNSAGSGSIAGIGIGPQGEPGGRKQLLFKRILRRKKVK